MLPVKSKYKIAKRLGAAIFEQTQTQKFALSEARAKKQNRKGGRGSSDYGRQLLEKQRVRFTYGITEKQLRNYAIAAYEQENPSLALHRALESRLDSAMYRAGFAQTRRAARQVVSHGHIIVNGTRITVPSYHIAKGDTLAVRDGSRTSPLFSHLGNPEATAQVVPQWLDVDASLMQAKVIGDIPYSSAESVLDYAAVFEFYSR